MLLWNHLKSFCKPEFICRYINLPYEDYSESACLHERERTKERFLFPVDDTKNDSPQKNVPHVGVPILKS